MKKGTENVKAHYSENFEEWMVWIPSFGDVFTGCTDENADAVTVTTAALDACKDIAGTHFENLNWIVEIAA